MGIIDFFGKPGKRGRDAAVEETPQAGKPAPLTSLEFDNPLDGLSIGFLFPLAFSVGSVPVRVRPLRLATSTEDSPKADAGAAAQSLDGPWFFWKADTPSGKLGGFWQLPGPPEDSATMESWNKTASALAAAAAIKLKETPIPMRDTRSLSACRSEYLAVIWTMIPSAP